MTKVIAEKLMIENSEFKTPEDFIKKHTTKYDWKKTWTMTDSSNDAVKVPVITSGKQSFTGPAIVMFKDTVTDKYAVGSTKNIANYLINFSFDEIDSGKYGAPAGRMAVPELYIKPCTDAAVAKEGASKIRAKIKKLGVSA